MIKVGTTFSGIGSPEQALKNLGIKHVVKWACDIDKNAKKTYLANHSCENWYDDITKIIHQDLEDIDLYVYGFPCTSISNAGGRKMEKGASGLVEYSLNILDEKLPKYFLFENVAALLQKNSKQFFDYIVERLTKNYNITYQVLNSKNFGVPQNRERIYCIGIRKDIAQTFEFPVGNQNIPKLKDFLDEKVDEKYYLSKEKQDTFTPSTRNFESDKVFVGGLRYGKLREDRKVGHMTNYGQLKQVFSIDGITPTICTWKDVGKFLMGDGRIRILTPNERRKLQGFPDGFILPVSENEQCRQFGNTITVNVLQEIFKQLLK